MKKSIISFLILLGLCLAYLGEASAQAVPHRINYQGIARNSDGTVVVSATIKIRVSILDGSPSSPAVYKEQFQVNTNQYGLFTFALGHGTPLLGTFESVDWGNGNYWLKQEVDVANNNNFLFFSNAELMSVPYALYAEQSGNAGPAGADGVAGISGAVGITGPTGPTGPYWTDQTGTYPDPAGSCGALGAPCTTPTDYVLGTSASTSSLSVVTPFSGLRRDSRHQYLFRASELTALGLGYSTISSIAFNVTLLNSTQPYTNYTVKMGCTIASNLTSGYIDGITTEVYTNAAFTPVVGQNVLTFQNTYNWDGVSNLLVEVCYDNTSTTSNDQVAVTNTPFSSVYGGYNFTTDISNTCTTNSFDVISANLSRPNVTFGACALTPLPPLTSPYIGYLDGTVIGSPTGGYKGPGTLNAVKVYDDNVLLTDYVFDKYLDGKVRPEDQKKHGGFAMLSIPEMRAYVEKERHLPSIKGRKEWNEKGPFSVGELSQQIWETVEINALYLSELDARMSALEAKAGLAPAPSPNPLRQASTSKRTPDESLIKKQLAEDELSAKK